MTTKFERDCNEIADKIGITVHFYGEGSNREPLYDDGFLHITKRKIRAVFNVDQDAPGKIQNERTRDIMNALGLSKKINDRVLIEEDDEPDEDDDRDYCPTCGHEW